MEKTAEEYRKILTILAKHLGDWYYKTGQYHNRICEAMEEYAATIQREQPPAGEGWKQLRDEFYKEMVDYFEDGNVSTCKVNSTPHNVFQWFKDRLSNTECQHLPLIDTGVGFYHCPACKRGWSYSEWKKQEREDKESPAPETAEKEWKEKVLDDAPLHYSNSQASAWADGYNAAMAALQQSNKTNKVL